MRYFSMFSGIGGFEKGIEDAQKSYGQQQTDTTLGGCRNSIGSQGQQLHQSEKRGNEFSRDAGQGSQYAAKKSEQQSTSSGDWECVGYSEIDRYASAIYRYHYPHQNYGDCRTINPDGLPDIDLIVGGFPCQSFSIAGKRGGFEDTRGTLFFEIARIARAKRPGYLWLENVKGLLSHNEGNTFATIIGTLDELGYDCQWQVLNSKNHGVPQNRERVFIIGNLRDRRRPKVFPFGEVSVGDITSQPNDSESQISRTVSSRFRKGVGNTESRIIDVLIDVPQAQRIRSIEGLASTLQGLAGGQGTKTGLYMVNLHEKRTGEWGNGEKRMDETSFTLDSGSGRDLTIFNIKENPQIRRLTPVECERLQGFTDNWTKYGLFDGKVKEISDTQRYKCCGNAVTTNVIRDIAIKWLGKV